LFLAPVYSLRMAGASGFLMVIGMRWVYSDFIDATPNA
jgi:hypothetical protein